MQSRQTHPEGGKQRGEQGRLWMPYVHVGTLGFMHRQWGRNVVQQMSAKERVPLRVTIGCCAETGGQ